MRAMKLAVAVLVLGGVLAAPVAAQNAPPAPKALVMTAQNVTALEEALRGAPRPEKEATVTRPGDVVEYQLLFTNLETFEAREVTFQNPLPAGMSYVPQSAGADRQDVKVEYSIDRGATWSERPEIEVVENGQKVRRPAPPELYTNVRWTIAGGIQPKAKVTAKYRAQLNGAPSKTTGGDTGEKR